MNSSIPIPFSVGKFIQSAFLILSVVACSFQSVFSQTAAPLVDATLPRHITLNQRTVAVFFTVANLTGSTTTGQWTVFINGSSVGVTVTGVSANETFGFGPSANPSAILVAVQFDASGAPGHLGTIPYLLPGETLTVRFTNTGSTLRTQGSNNPVLNFGPLTSKNTYSPNATGVGDILYQSEGIASVLDQCSPVNTNYWRFTYLYSLRFRNSTAWTTVNNKLRVVWGSGPTNDLGGYLSNSGGDPSITQLPVNSFTGANPGVFVSFRAGLNLTQAALGNVVVDDLTNPFTYPDNTGVCNFRTTHFPVSTVAPIYSAIGDASLQKNTQFDSYDYDNTLPGAMNMTVVTPPASSTTTTNLVCLGTNVGARLLDASLFNCIGNGTLLSPPAANPNTTPVNNAQRWVRFVYGGVSAATVIPDIRVNGQQVTTNAPVPALAPAWINNPNLTGSYASITDFTPNAAPLTNGYVVPGIAAFPASIAGTTDIFGVTALNVAATATTSGLLSQLITTLSTTNQAVNQQFNVTIQYWNACNPYPSSAPVEYTTTVADGNAIRIIPKPLPAVPTQKNFCQTEDMSTSTPAGPAPPATCTTCFEVTAASVLGNTEIKWYTTLANANADASPITNDYGTQSRFLRPTEIVTRASGGTGVVPDAGPAAGDTYSVWIRYRTAAPPSDCLSDPVEVRIVKREQLTTPTSITSTSTFPICSGVSGVPFTAAPVTGSNPLGGAWNYTWSVTGADITISPAGPTTQNMTLNIASIANGAKTVNALRKYATLTTDSKDCASTNQTFNFTANFVPIGGTTSGGTSPICLGSNIGTITLAGSSGTRTWQVSTAGALGPFSDIAPVQTGTTLSVTPAASGTYHYRVRVSNPVCSDVFSSASSAIVVREALATPTAFTNPGFSFPICSNTNGVTFNTTPATGSNPLGGAWNYTWGTTGGGLTINPATTSANMTLDIAAATSGAKSVTAFASYTTAPACPSATRTQNFTVDLRPVGGSITGGLTPICLGSSTGTGGSVMTLTGSSGSVLQWEVDSGSGFAAIPATAGLLTYSETPVLAGTYIYRVRLNNLTNLVCAPVVSATRTIIVREALPAPGAITSTSTFPLCAGVNGVAFSSASPAPGSNPLGGPWNYTWGTTGGGLTINPAGPTTTAMTLDIASATSGAKTATIFTKYTTNDAYGSACPSSTTSVPFNVNRITAVLSATPTTICPAASSNLSITITGGVSPYEVVFFNGTGNTTVSGYSSGSNISTGPLGATTTYSIISVKDANNCFSISNTGTPTITVGSVMSAAVFSGGTTVCMGTPVNLSLVITGGVAPYQVTVPGATGSPFLAYTSGSAIPVPTGVAGTINYSASVVLDACGNSFPIGSVTGNSQAVIVNQAPILFPYTPADICSGGTFTVTPVNGVPAATTIIPAGTTYTWTAPSISPTPGSLTGASAQPVGQPSISQTLTNTTNVVQTATYTVTPTSGAPQSCVGATFTVTVNVNPRPVIPAQTPAAICSGLAFTVSPTNGGAVIVPAGTTYTWTAPSISPTPGSLTGASAQAVGQPNISQTLTNTTNVVQTATYTVTPTSTVGGTCVGATFTITIPVNPKPEIPAQTPAAICSGLAFTVAPTNGGAVIVPAGTTYTWTAPSISPTPGSLTGASAQAVGQPNISQTLTNTTNVVQTATYTVTPTSAVGGTCVGSTFTVTIPVNPKPVIPNQTPTAICSDLSFTVTPTNGGAVIVPAGTTYTWTAPSISPTPGSLTGASAQAVPQANISQTLTNTTNVVQTATYTVTPTSAVGGTCVGSTFTVAIPVNPKPVIPNQTPSGICSGLAFTVTPANGGAVIVPTGTTYTWTAPSISPTPGSLTGASAQAVPQANISQILTNTTNVVQTATYTVTPTSAVGGTCVGSTFTVTIPINPKPVIFNYTPADICSGGTFTAVIPANGIPAATTIVPAGTTYAWGIPSMTGGVTGGTAASGQTSISQTLTNPSTATGTATYTVTPTSSVGGTCVGSTFQVVVTVHPIPKLSSTLAPAAICSGTFNYTATSATTGPGAVTFAWTRAAVPFITQGATSGSTAIISEPLTNTGTAPVNVTYNIITSANGCTNGPAGENVVVRVDPTPVPNPIIGPASVCVSATTTYFYQVTQVAGSTYRWNVPAGFTVQAAGGGATGGGGLGPATADYFILLRFLVPNDPTPQALSVTEISSNGCVGVANVLPILVSAISPPGLITSSSGATSFCKSQTGVVFQVPQNANSNFIWSTDSGATIIGPSAGTNLYQIVVNFNSSPTATLNVTEVNLNGCPTIYPALPISLLDPPVMTPTTGAICSGSQPSSVITLSTTPAVASNFSWIVKSKTANISGAFVNDVGSGPITHAPALTNISGVNGTIVYTVTPTATASPFCIGAPLDITVTVKPEPVVAAIANQSVCPLTFVNGTVAFPFTDNAGGAISWTSSGDPIGLAASGTGNISFTTLDNQTGLPLVSTVTVVSLANGCTSAGANAKTFTITLKPRPVVGVVSDFLVCPGDVVNVPALTANTSGGETYAWTNNNTAIGLVASGTGNISSFFATNNTGADLVANISVIGTLSSCPGPAETFTITVKAKPSGSNSTKTAVCSDAPFNFDPQSNISNGVASTFSWVAVYDGGSGQLTGGAGTGTGNLSETLNNISGSTRNAVYTITPQAITGLCFGTAFTITVPILSEPVGASALKAAQCSDVAFSFNPQTDITNGVTSTYAWTAVYDGGSGLLTGGAGIGSGLVAETLTNVSGIQRSAVYTITPSSLVGSCAGSTFQITVPVNPKPVGISSTKAAQCSGVAFSFNPQSDISNAVTSTFTWTGVYDSGSGQLTGGASSGTGTISETLNNTSSTQRSVVYTITPTASTGACVGSTFTITVPINPKPNGANASKAAQCSDVAFSFNPQADITNAVTSTFAWTAVYDGGSGQLAGGAGTGTGLIAETITNISGIQRNAVYTVTPTATTGGCVGSSYVITVPINPEPVGATATKSAQCSDVAFSFNLQLDITNGVTSSFTWTASYDGGSGQLTGGAGAGSGLIAETLTNLSGIQRNAVYTVTPSATTGGCAGSMFVITIPINPEPVGANAIKAAQCSGVAFSFNPQSDISNSVASTFAWTAVYDGGSGQLTGGSTSGTGNISETLNNVSGIQRSAVYTITPSASTGTCVGSTFTITVPVNPRPVGASATKTAQCSDVAFNFNPQSDITNAVTSTFAWTAVYDGGSGQLVGGAGTGTGPIAETITNISGIQRNAVYTVTPTSSVGGCAGTSFVITIPINPEPVGANATKTAQCSDVAFSFNPQTDVSNGVLSTFAWTAVYDGGSGLLTGGAGTGTGLLAETLTNLSGIQRSAVYTVTPTSSTGTCLGSSFTITVPVNPEPVGANAAKAAQCSGVAFSFNPQSDITNAVTATFSWTAIYDGGSGQLTGGANSGTGLISETLNNVSSIQRSAVYTITPSASTGSCVGSTFTITVPVNPRPVGASATKTAQCSDVAFSINPQSDITNAVTSTFAWTAVYDGGSGQLTGGAGSGTGPLAETITNLSSITRNAVYTVTPTSSVGGCAGTSFVITIPINPEPVGANATKTAQCSDVAFSFNPQTDVSNGVTSTFAWTAVYDGGSGLLTGGAGTGTGLLAETLTNLSGIQRSAVYTVTPTSSTGTCLGSTFTITVPVNPEPVGANAAKAAQCSGVAFSFNPQSDITNSVTATFSWTAVYDAGSGLLTGGSGTGTGLLAETLVNLTSIQRNAVYTITPSASTGSCVGSTYTITIPVSPQPVGGNTTKATQCSDVAFSFNPQTDISNGVASTFTWTAMYDGGSGQLTGGVGSGIGAVAETITNLSGTTRNVVYTVTPRSVTGTCFGSTFTITVPIQSEPVGAASTKTTQCSDVAFSFNPQSDITNSVTSTFTWTAVYDGGSGQLTGGVGSGAGALAETLTNLSGTTRNAVYTVTPTSSTGSCIGSAFVITIPIRSEPVGANATKTAQCSGAAFSFSPQTDITNGIASTFTWTAVYDGGSGLLTGGANTGSGALAETLINLTGAAKNAVYTVTPTSSTGTCVGSAFVITVPINPQPVGAAATMAVQCSDVAFSFDPQTNITNLVSSTFTWTAIYDGGSGQLTGGAGSGTGNLAETITNVSGGTRNAVYTITPRAVTGLCFGSTFIITVPIQSEPMGAAATRAAQCSDVPFSVSANNIVNGMGATSTYAWVLDPLPGGLTLVTPGPGTGANISGTIQNLTGGQLTATYTVTPTSAAGCAGDTYVISVPVNPEPVGANSTQAAQCSGVAFSFNPQLSITNLVPSSFTWTAIYDGSSGLLTGGAGSGSGFVSETLINLTGVVRNAVYTVTPSATTGSCTGSTFTITVPVNPQPVGANITKTAQCSDAAFSFNPQADITNGLASTFTWTAVYDLSSGQLTGGSGSGIGSINETLTNLSGTTRNAVYTVIPREGTTLCFGSAFLITVPVRSEPVGANATKTTQCSNTAFSFNPQSDISNSVASNFAWTAVYDGGSGFLTGGAGSGTGFLAETLINVTGGVLNAVYTVTPTSQTGTCVGSTFVITIPINSEPLGANSTKADQCSGVAFSFNPQLDITNTVTSTFTWTAVYDGGSGQLTGGANSGSGTITETLVNISGTQRSAVYTITPRATTGNCLGATYTITVPVNSQPVGVAATKVSQCSDVAFSFDPQLDISNGLASTFTWTAVYDGGSGQITGGAGTGTGLLAETLTNTSGNTRNAVYTVIPRDGTSLCFGAAFVITIPIKSEPIGTATTRAAQCSDVAFSVSANNVTNGMGASSTYTWVRNALPGGLTQVVAGTGTGAIAETLQNLSGGQLIATYTVTPRSAGNCDGDPYVISVPVNSEPVGAAITRATQCSDVPFSVSADNITNGMGATTTYAWSRNALPGGLTLVTAGSGTGAIAETLQNLTGGTLSATYSVTPTASTGCIGNTYIITVPVNPEPVAPLVTTIQVCSDEALNYNIQTSIINNGGSGGNSVPSKFRYTVLSSLPAVSPAAPRATASTANITDTYTNLASVDATITYLITPISLTGDCEGTPFEFKVVVHPEPVGINILDPVCSTVLNHNIQTAHINATGGNSLASVFTYTVSSTNGIAVPPAANRVVASSANITDTYVNASGSPVDITYLITPFNAANPTCVGTPFTYTVRISPKPQGGPFTEPLQCSNVAFSFNPQDVINDNTTVPPGNSVVSTFTWSASYPPGIVVQTAGTGVGSINETLRNRTSGTTVLNVVYTVTPTAGTCVGNTFDITVPVKPEPVGANALANVNSDVILNYDLQNNINTVGNTVPSTFSWVAFINSNVGGESTSSQSGALITDVLNNVTNANQTVIYTATPTGTNGCAGASFLVTVTVLPEPVGVDASLIINSDVANNYSLQNNVNSSGNGVPSTFVWVAAPNGNVIGESVAPQAGGTINDNINNITGIDQFVIYTVTPTGTNGVLGNPFTITVTVRSEPLGSDDVAVTCSDIAAGYDLQNNLNTPPGNGQAATFSWVATANPSVTGESTTPQIGAFITDVIRNVTNGDEIVSYTVTPTGTNGCLGNTFQIDITVRPEPVVATTLNETKCSGEAYGKLLTTNGTSIGAATYDVTVVSKDTGITGGRPLGLIGTGGSADNILLTDSYVNTTATPLKVIYSIVPNGTNGCIGDARLVEFSINPEPVLSVPAPTAICSNNTQNPSTTGIVLGTNGISVNAPTYRIDQIEYSNGGPFSAATPTGFTFPVTNKLVASSGGINHIQGDRFTNTSLVPVVVRYTIVPISVQPCEGDPVQISITVNPEPKLDPALSPTPICSGDRIDPLGTAFQLQSQPAVSVASASFIIRSISFPGLTAGSSNTGTGSGKNMNSMDNDTYINITTAALTATYSIAPVSATGCIGPDQTVIITVNPAPAMKPGLDRIVCNDGISNIVLQDNSPTTIGASTYDIISVTVGGIPIAPGATVSGLTANAGNATLGITASINRIRNDRFVNTTNDRIVVSYQVVPISTPGCRGPQGSITLTVEPSVISTTVNSAPSICSGDAIALTFVSPSYANGATTNPVVTFSYTMVAVTGISGNTLGNNLSEGTTISDVLVNTTNNPITVNYKVTPRASAASNGVGCTGAVEDVFITVQPRPKITAINNKTVCESDPINLSLVSTTVPGSGLIKFFVTAVPSSGNVTGFTNNSLLANNSVLGDVLANNGSVTESVTYTIEPRNVTAGNVTICAGPSIEVIVTVSPRPNITPIADFAICSGEPFNPIAIVTDTETAIPGSTLVTWTVTPDATVTGESNGAGNSFSQVLFNNSSDKRTVVYTINAKNITNSPSCSGTPITLNVTVYPVPKLVSLPSSVNVCNNGTLTPNPFILNSSVVSSLSPVFDWTIDDGANPDLADLPSVTGGTSINQTFVNTGTFLGTYQYTITPRITIPVGANPLVGNTCTGQEGIMIVNVAPPVNGEIYGFDINGNKATNLFLCKGAKEFVYIDPIGLPLMEVVYKEGSVTKTLTKLGGLNILQVSPTVTTVYELISVKDKFGCVKNINQTVTVNVDAVSNEFEIVGPTISCSPFQVQFKHDQIAGVNYTWKWLDGPDSTTYQATSTVMGKIIKHTFLNPSPSTQAKFKVSLEAFLDTTKYQLGCKKLPFVKEVKVYPTISTGVFPDNTVLCSGETVKFVNTSQGVSASGHRWFYRVFGSTQELEVKTTSSVTYKLVNESSSNPIIYEVVYRATNGNCPADEVVTPITVYRGATAKFDEGVVPPHIGGHSIVTFSNLTAPIDASDFRYEWEFGADAVPPSANGVGPFTIDYLTPGDKDVILTVTNTGAEADGRTCVYEFRKTINILLLPLVANFKATPQEACFPSDIAVTENTATGDLMEWRVVDSNGRVAATSNANLPVFQITNPGTYSIFLKTSSSFTGQEANTQQDNFEIYPVPVASFDARPSLLFVPDTELVTYNFTTGATDYLWDFGDNGTSTEEEPKYLYKIEGVYDLTLIALNDHGNGVVCSDTLSRKITAKQGGVTKVPNAFTPNPNGPNGGVSGNGSFNDVFLPYVKGAEEFNMQIYDRWGNLIFESNNSTIGWDGYDRNGRLMQSGVYVYKLTLRLSDGQRTTQIGDITMIR